MFNDKFLLTQLVLEEKKTETRRNQTLSLHKKKGKGGNWVEIFPTKIYLEEGKWKVEYDNLVFSLPKANYPKYEIGEEVAIAQSYRDCGGLNEDGVPRWDVISKTVGATNAGWKYPSARARRRNETIGTERPEDFIFSKKIIV